MDVEPKHDTTPAHHATAAIDEKKQQQQHHHQQQHDGSSARTGASSSDEDLVPYDPKLEREVRWRRDLVLVPVMGILYTLLFLDRTNIANARIIALDKPWGLEESLDMPSNGYNTALWIFYIPFVLAEIPANLLLNKNYVRPGIFLGVQAFLLGVLGFCQGLTQSYGGLLAVRFLMGTFEASLPAGATYIMAMYYTKRECQIRFAWFFNFALAGPLFSGVLAYAIGNLEGARGLEAWRWIFIIEGLMTCVIALGVLAFCPNFPADAQAWFLKPHQRDHVIRQVEASRGSEGAGSSADDVPLWRVLLDWRIHLLTWAFFCLDVTAGSVSAFSPTILAEMGYHLSIAQVMTIPIWATGIVFTFSVTWLAARANCRTPFVLACICSQLVGWIILKLYVPSVGVRYLALFFLSAGTYPQMAMLLGWLAANLRGRKHLAVGMAWMTGFGNCANFVSSNVFITTERPVYPTGTSITLAFTAMGFATVCLAATLFTLKNRRRERERAGMNAAQREAYDEINFKYVL